MRIEKQIIENRRSFVRYGVAAVNSPICIKREIAGAVAGSDKIQIIGIQGRGGKWHTQ